MDTSKATYAAVAAMTVTLSVGILVLPLATPIAANIECETPTGKAPRGWNK